MARTNSSNKLQQLFKDTLKCIRENWVILLIVVLATWLRVWKIDQLGILFGDAGRDLLVAKQAVITKKLPLVGIPSSVPRFHQGPLTVWLQMLIYLMVGNQTWVYQIVFALIGVAAIIALYEYTVTHFNQKTAWVASALLAFAPMAIAHSRVPYHTTPIPLVMVIFLFSLHQLWQKKKHGVFWATLGWALIMQFELTLVGLVTMIPYIVWRRKIKLEWHHLSEFAAAGIIGFLPQIIHDLTSPITQSQTGGFAAWVGYRLISLTGMTGEHMFTFNRFFNQTLTHYWLYWQRMFTVQNSLIALGLLGLVGYVFYLISQQKKLKPALEITTVAFIVLTISYIIHGAPSEAYFPPYLILVSILLAWGLVEIFKKKMDWLWIGLGAWALINIFSLFRNNFMVSNHGRYTYHGATEEQRQIIRYVHRVSNGYWQLATTAENGKFPAYFDNFRWLSQEMNLQENKAHGLIFYVEDKDSELKGYPGFTRAEFSSYDVYYR